MGFLIRHAVGFLLQLVPCIILFMLPFSKEDYKVPFRIFIRISTGVIIGIAISFSMILFMVREQSGAAGFYGDIYMAGTWIVGTLCYFFIIRQSFWKKIMTFCISVTYGIGIYMIVNFTIQILPASYIKWVEWELYEPGIFILYVLAVILTFPPMAAFVMKVLKKYLIETEEGVQKKSAIGLCIFTIIYLVTISLATYSENDLEYDIRFPVILLLFLFATICTGIVYYFLFWEIRQMKKKQQMEKMLEIQRLQYKNIQQEIANTKRIRHDLRQKQRMLYKLLEDNKIAEAKNILLEDEKQTNNQGKEQFCSEPMVNALLQYYSTTARDNGIDYQIKARIQKSPIPVLELVVLLGNMLENAVTACKSAGQDTYIKLDMGIIQGTLVISMENSCEYIELTGRGRTDGNGWMKREAFSSGKGGGIGLHSMEQTAEKYGGNAEFKYVHPVFYTHVILYEKEK